MVKKIEQKFYILEYSSIEELEKDDRKLLEMAVSESQSAYAPYSGFNVGAAVRLNNGKVVGGNNQENVAYPSGLCAERVAVFSAASQYSKAIIESVAISAFSKKFEFNRPIAPCGACRQSIAEYEVKQKTPIRLILGGSKGKIQIIEGVINLLPFLFYEEGLKV